MKTSAVIRELIAAGLSGDELVAAVERIEASDQPKRSSGAERQARYRAKQASQVTESDACDVTSVTSDGVEQKENTPHTPQKKNNNTPPIAPPSEIRGTRLPNDWKPEPLPVGFAQKHGITHVIAENELERFRDYWIGVAGAKGRKTDWQATWRNWLRKAVENRAAGPPRRQTAFQNTMDGLAEYLADDGTADQEITGDVVRKLSFGGRGAG